MTISSRGPTLSGISSPRFRAVSTRLNWIGTAQCAPASESLVAANAHQPRLPACTTRRTRHATSVMAHNPAPRPIDGQSSATLELPGLTVKRTAPLAVSKVSSSAKSGCVVGRPGLPPSPQPVWAASARTAAAPETRQRSGSPALSARSRRAPARSTADARRGHGPGAHADCDGDGGRCAGSPAHRRSTLARPAAEGTILGTPAGRVSSSAR